MEPKVNYVAVGIFVFLFGILGAAIFVWLISSGSIRQNYKRFIVLTNQDVSGLHVDSTVKYKGLDVGRVFMIEIDKNDPAYIKIYIEVEKKLPINEQHTVAQISANGLTGLAYLNLLYSKKVPTLPKGLNNFKYPVIMTVPSTINTILDELPYMVKSISKAANRLSGLLDKRTEFAAKKTVNNLEKLTKDLNETRHKLDELIVSSNKFIGLLSNNSKELSQTLKLTNGLILNLDNLTQSIKGTVNQVRETTVNESYNALKELEETLRQLKQLIIEVKNNPRLILQGRKNLNVPVEK